MWCKCTMLAELNCNRLLFMLISYNIYQTGKNSKIDYESEFCLEKSYCLCSFLIHYHNLVFSLFWHLILFSHISDITKNPNLASHKFHCREPGNLSRGHKRKDVNSIKINYALITLSPLISLLLFLIWNIVIKSRDRTDFIKTMSVNI